MIKSSTINSKKNIMLSIDQQPHYDEFVIGGLSTDFFFVQLHLMLPFTVYISHTTSTE